MSLTLPKPSPQYDAGNEAQTRSAMESNDGELMRKRQDVDITNRRLILQSPDGTLWSVTVDNAGTISAASI